MKLLSILRTSQGNPFGVSRELVQKWKKTVLALNRVYDFTILF